MTDRILKALGATDELDALRVIAEANQFLADVKEATGRETFAHALEVMKSSVALSRELCALTEKPEQESLGIVVAWKSSHDKLPAIETEKAALDERVRSQEVKALIAAGLESPRPGANEHAGKLNPATAKYFESRPVADIQAFLAVASRVFPGEVKPPQVVGSTVFAPNAEGRIANAENKTYEQLLPAARSELKKSDPDLYRALRSDWERMGKPPGVVAN